MSWWMQKYSGVQDVSGTTGVIAECYADTESDIGTRTDFSGFTLLASSTCHVIDDGSDWMLDTAGTWHKQPDQHTTQLDLSGYYTKSEVDAAVAAASIAALGSGSELPANSDLDTLLSAGSWYCAATNANTCANRPLGTTTGGFGVKNLVYFGDNRIVQLLVYNVISGTAFNRFFVRVYRSTGWGAWDEISKVPVS